MGTLSTKKFIKNIAGALTEEFALTTSAGAADANLIPALNAAGILDDTILNASAASSANKVVKQTAGGIIDPTVVNATITSAGAGSSGKIVQLDGAGRIDSTVLPVGVGADTTIMVASEALAAGAFVNVFSSTGAKVRNADATVAGKHAMGFVLSAVASAANATVYFEGTNTAVTGQTPGDVFLSTTAGIAVATSPSGAGTISQNIGIAISATAINFQYNRPVTQA